ncbi:transcriptional regulator [Emticicia agri]|uniref:Transcriptional regulator n=1 Tax=Emticicia agri TaxID=2492393 RepID=A0A4Q5M550_9BACT|nr:transcriptional regulator [Emticicia agri]
MTITPIKTAEEYTTAMNNIRQLWDCPENSKEADLLEVLSILVEDYEKKQYSITPLDPIEAIKYKMEEEGLNQKDLVKYFGSKERVSEVLNKKRPLTLRMIKNLYHNLGISADSLLAL